MSEYIIRKCAPADAPQLADLGASLFVQAYGDSYGEPDLSPFLARSFDAELLERELGHPNRCALLIERADGELMGYAYVIETAEIPDCIVAENPIEINKFYVDERWHGHGVAKDLMAACEEEARARGGDVLWLQASKDAPRAVGFYRRQGFQIVGNAFFHFGSRVENDYIFARPVQPHR